MAAMSAKLDFGEVRGVRSSILARGCSVTEVKVRGLARLLNAMALLLTSTCIPSDVRRTWLV